MPDYRALKSFVGKLPGGEKKYVAVKGDVLTLPPENEWDYVGLVERIKSEKKRGKGKS